MKTMGLRHVALNVKNAQAAKEFYCRVLKMEVEWEPDPKTVYVRTQSDQLTNGRLADNLALHQADAPLHRPGALNHIGFIMPTLNDVDAWHDHIVACKAKIVKEIKTHRDGARSFYFEDLDGNVIQMLYHPPLAGTSA
jgi:catechol 2,3-dioxygenase-like lactoylglutathione lyase family enzyme